MTIYGHMESLNISTLKAHLSNTIRRVRDGVCVLVLDRDVPVALLTPYKPTSRLVVRKPVGKLSVRTSKLRVRQDPLYNLPDP